MNRPALRAHIPIRIIAIRTQADGENAHATRHAEQFTGNDEDCQCPLLGLMVTLYRAAVAAFGVMVRGSDLAQ